MTSLLRVIRLHFCERSWATAASRAAPAAASARLSPTCCVASAQGKRCHRRLGGRAVMDWASNRLTRRHTANSFHCSCRWNTLSSRRCSPECIIGCPLTMTSRCVIGCLLAMTLRQLAASLVQWAAHPRQAGYRHRHQEDQYPPWSSICRWPNHRKVPAAQDGRGTQSSLRSVCRRILCQHAAARIWGTHRRCGQFAQTFDWSLFVR